MTVGEAEEAGPLERLLRDQAALAERERVLAGRQPAPAAAVSPPVAAEPAPASAVAEPVPAPSVRTVPDPEPPPAPAREAAAAAGGPADVRQLRTKVRSDRLRTDPTVDEDLVTRLIEGVEGL